MKIFNTYSDYYDLLYSDKDYASEVEYIDQLIHKHYPNAKSILNLGCGTGNHDFFLARHGYQVTGVDFSENNIKKAKNKLLNSNFKDAELNFTNGDIRTIRLEKKFDIVLALFHVISYQISNDDIKAAFSTAKAHLCNNGIFIFDCWYGPAVLTDRPTVRLKDIENEHISIRRIAEPEMFPNENRVHVNYLLILKEKSNNQMSEIRETHKMRYLFKPEIENMLNQAGFELLHCKEWMTNNETGFKTWNACFIASCGLK
jgi:SAM-dependent methyltransferase